MHFIDFSSNEGSPVYRDKVPNSICMVPTSARIAETRNTSVSGISCAKWRGARSFRMWTDRIQMYLPSSEPTHPKRLIRTNPFEPTHLNRLISSDSSEQTHLKFIRTDWNQIRVFKTLTCRNSNPAAHRYQSAAVWQCLIRTTQQ